MSITFQINQNSEGPSGGERVKAPHWKETFIRVLVASFMVPINSGAPVLENCFLLRLRLDGIGKK